MTDFEQFESTDIPEHKTQIVIPKVSDEPVSKGLATLEDGQIALSSLEEQLAFAKRLITEKMVSQTFETPQQVVVGIQYAKSMNLPVVPALRMMYVLQGRPCLYGDGPLALVQRSESFGGIHEFFLNEKMEQICTSNKNLKDPVFAAVTKLWRDGDPTPQEDYFTLEDLARAKIDQSKFGKKDVWEKYRRNMMRYKARSMALKTKFADLISGIDIAEYNFDADPSDTGMEIQNVSDLAREINEKYRTSDAT